MVTVSVSDSELGGDDVSMGAVSEYSGYPDSEAPSLFPSGNHDSTMISCALWL